MNNTIKFFSVFAVVGAVILAGCNDEDEKTANINPAQYSQQPTEYAQSQPSVVVVDSGNASHSSGPSMGDIMVGSAVGTMIGNHLSNNNSGYRDRAYDSRYRNDYNSRTTKNTTIINNHYNSNKPSGLSLTKPTSKPVKSYSSTRTVTKTYRTSSRRR